MRSGEWRKPSWLAPAMNGCFGKWRGTKSNGQCETTTSVAALILCGLFIVAFSGCHHKPTDTDQVVEHLPSDLSPIGIASARFTPEVTIKTPAKGFLMGAGRGAAKGAEEGLNTFPLSICGAPAFCAVLGLLDVFWG